MAVNKLRNIEEIIYILGTNHLAHSSRETVEYTITKIKPDVVMIEIDEERLKLLKEKRKKTKNQAKSHSNTNQSNAMNLITTNKGECASDNNFDRFFDNTSPGIPTQLELEFEESSNKAEDFPTSNNDDANLSGDRPNREEINHNASELPSNEFFSLFEQIQSQFGQILQIIPGEELLTAVDVVQERRIPLKCIDLSISEIIEQISHSTSTTTASSESNLLVNAIKEEQIPNSIDELKDLFTLLEDEKELCKLLSEFSSEFPQLSKALIDDRNVNMAKQIKKYHKCFPKHRILVICGAFHVPGIINLLKSA
ncbi:MAG: TraB/GumN family protein [Promethearchaeota archaeon]